jgi:hypothetical protein
MSIEQTLAATALAFWKIELERADKFFSALTDEQLPLEIAPGRNRLVYLWGHLIAVHDRMLPLLGIGERVYPYLDAPSLLEADRSEKLTTLPPAADLKRWWDEVNSRLTAGLSNFTPADWAAKHTAVSDEAFAANPLRNRLAVLLSRTAHISSHLGQAVIAAK